MRNIKLIVAYDGTDFCGFQSQGGGKRAVQSEIEAALSKLHKEPARITGAGRTDAGVHAAGQVVNFYTPLARMPAERFAPALNGLLPPDIRVREASAAAGSFHARFDAVMRCYRYFLICGRDALPHERRCALSLRRMPDLSLLNAYCRSLRGEFDCSIFRSPRDGAFLRGGRSPFRYIRHCCFYVQGTRLVFEVSANAFFWKMVRSMLGTLLFYEERRMPPAGFAALLKSGERGRAGPTIPPRGLFLWNVEYDGPAAYARPRPPTPAPTPRAIRRGAI